MVIVDAHCDTLTKAVNSGMGLVHNSYHWDVERALQYDGFVQVLAVFQDPDEVTPTFPGAMHYIQEAESMEKQSERFKLCKSFNDIQNGLKEKRVCTLLSLEGGEALEGKMDNLYAFHQAGIRCITLTWNGANELGDGALAPQKRGLTLFGRRVVQWMQENRMLVDISHAGEKTFWDCMAVCFKPMIASHSNARALHNHPRNLWNNQINAIANNHGVIGINLYTEFIGPPKKNDITALIRHIEHICGITGDETVGIGADFDGMNSLPDPILGVQSLQMLFDELARLNYTEKTIQKIAGENFLRVFRDVFAM